MPKCEEDGCDKEGDVACRLSDYDHDTKEFKEYTYHYCAEHATKNGFCWGCSEFWAGVEDFEFHPSKLRLCENCRDEIAYEMGEIDEGEESPDYEEDDECQP